MTAPRRVAWRCCVVWWRCVCGTSRHILRHSPQPTFNPLFVAPTRAGGDVKAASCVCSVGAQVDTPCPPAAHLSLLIEPPVGAAGENAERRRCRICFDGDFESETTGQLSELACACRGELRFAHDACALTWFAKRGSGVCELCHQPAFVLPENVLKEIEARRNAHVAALVARAHAHGGAYAVAAGLAAARQQQQLTQGATKKNAAPTRLWRRSRRVPQGGASRGSSARPSFSRWPSTICAPSSAQTELRRETRFSSVVLR